MKRIGVSPYLSNVYTHLMVGTNSYISIRASLVQLIQHAFGVNLKRPRVDVRDVRPAAPTNRFPIPCRSMRNAQICTHIHILQYTVYVYSTAVARLDGGVFRACVRAAPSALVPNCAAHLLGSEQMLSPQAPGALFARIARYKNPPTGDESPTIRFCSVSATDVRG